MTFKADWEKTNTRFDLAPDIVTKMIKIAYPDADLKDAEVINGGCANLNIKINLKEAHEPLILRIYLRDSDAVWREQNIAKLLEPAIPVPYILQISEYENYVYSIAEFKHGITLRDLLLSNQRHSISKIMYKVGVIFSGITKHKFPLAGFFDKNLNVVTELSNNDYFDFVKNCLESDVILNQIGNEMVAKIERVIYKYADLFPTNQERSLVHGDFDPANILFAQQDGEWEITGVLDWEFAFSGSILCDVASMLRYAHKMPIEFEKSFLNGLQDNNIILPQSWEITVDLLNLLSLLDCLVRIDSNRPMQKADIIDLISHILKRLGAH